MQNKLLIAYCAGFLNIGIVDISRYKLEEKKEIIK